jgi:lipopolysaccharide export system permease protein
MLFHSSIRKELARSFGATLVVLSTIVMTILLIRTLGQASRGSVNPSEILLVMGFTVLGHLPTLLTLSLFISIVATLSRMYTDSEMVIWFSSGRGLAGFLPPLFRFAWPIVLAVTVLALLVWPWSNQQTLELKLRYEKRGDIERIAPGQFQESADGSRVFFVDKDSPDKKSGNNVFISSVENGRAAVTTARSGRIEVRRDERFLLLNNGQRLENAKDGSLELKLNAFEEYGIRISEDVLAAQSVLPAKSISTLALLQEPSRIHLGELGWRLGLALASINLVLLALAVSSVNPRVGRSGNLIFALLSFVVYYNLINLGQSWIAAGRISLLAYLVYLHGGALVAALLWLASRHQNWSLRSWTQRMRGKAPGVRA